MQEYILNMADIKNRLQVSPERMKVEVRHYASMRHAIRFHDESLVKQGL